MSRALRSSELERALQTPTFEALQQKADQATRAFAGGAEHGQGPDGAVRLAEMFQSWS